MSMIVAPKMSAAQALANLKKAVAAQIPSATPVPNPVAAPAGTPAAVQAAPKIEEPQATAQTVWEKLGIQTAPTVQVAPKISGQQSMDNYNAAQTAKIPPVQTTAAPVQPPVQNTTAPIQPPAQTTAAPVQPPAQTTAAPVQPPVATVAQPTGNAAVDTGLTNLGNSVTDLNQNLNTNNADFAAQREAQMAQLKNILSTGNFDAVLQKVMASLMPMYNAQESMLQDKYDEFGRKIDIDAERRGIYNSGIAANSQRKNNVSLGQELSAILAGLQGSALDQTNTYLGQQLQGIGMQGDYLSQDRSAGQQDYQAQLAAALGMNEATLNSILGMGNLGVAQQNANTNSTAVGNDFTLGQGNLGVSQQNANTNATNVANNYNIAQQGAGTDAYNAETSRLRATNDLALGLGDLNISQRQLDESVRQFDERQAFDETLRADDMTKFAGSMGLDWAKLGVTEKLGMLNAASQNESNKLAANQFASEQELIKSQQARENLQTSIAGYNMIYQMQQNAAASGISNEELQADLAAMIEPYKTYNPELYAELKAAIAKSATSNKFNMPFNPAGTLDDKFLKTPDNYSSSPNGSLGSLGIQGLEIAKLIADSLGSLGRTNTPPPVTDNVPTAPEDVKKSAFGDALSQAGSNVQGMGEILLAVMRKLGLQ